MNYSQARIQLHHLEQLLTETLQPFGVDVTVRLLEIGGPGIEVESRKDRHRFLMRCPYHGFDGGICRDLVKQARTITLKVLYEFHSAYLSDIKRYVPEGSTGVYDRFEGRFLSQREAADRLNEADRNGN